MTLSSFLCLHFLVYSLASISVCSYTFLPAQGRRSYVLQTKLAVEINSKTIEIHQHLGSGSYGTVYLCDYTDDIGRKQRGVAKRAWNLDEITALHPNADKQTLLDKVKRANYYLSVEEHCLTKARDRFIHMDKNRTVPIFVNTFQDHEYKWMVTKLISRNQDAAKSLKHVMERYWADRHSEQSRHHLFVLQTEMGLSNDSTIGDTLDLILLNLLQCVEAIHSINILHRDIKPENLLVDSKQQSLVLIDFGSSADLDPISSSTFGWNKKRIGLEDDSVVALSPIYSAPEQFVKVDRNPLSFDVFSIAMIFFQLLFNFSDERTDAAFRQQLYDSNYDIDTWLTREISTTIRPVGLEDALLYLDERSGLWHLLQHMTHPDPLQRISSKEAYQKAKHILSTKDLNSIDGDFFKTIVSTVETCDVPSEDTVIDSSSDYAALRPLHFVASFDRSQPLGLLLSEADGKNLNWENIHDELAWDRATANASHDEVFIQGLVDDGQASKMGIFRIGDRIRAIGDIPFVEGGFEGLVKMLAAHPKSSKTVKLYFDRKYAATTFDRHLIRAENSVRIDGHGVWSLRGRRTVQEDAFIIHEILHPSSSSNILLAGVFDGHGGRAASKTASQVIPSLFTLEMQTHQKDTTQALIAAWNRTCDTYRDGCSLYGACVADYDPKEGIVFAEHGAENLVAGTTATMVALDQNTDEITVLNCGDSRAIIFSDVPFLCGNASCMNTWIHFATRDHKPYDDQEMKRLREGKAQGYSQPECSTSRYWITIGDYQYSVSRSLEGKVATAKGIVSDAEVSRLNLSRIIPQESIYGAIVVATDGLFDVMSNEEVAAQVIQRMKNGIRADDASKELCMLAHQKGSLDNISIIIIYLSL